MFPKGWQKKEMKMWKSHLTVTLYTIDTAIRKCGFSLLAFFLLGACGKETDAQNLFVVPVARAPLLHANSCQPNLRASGALVKRFKDQLSSFGLVCSATLVAPNVVLTAGHCLADEPSPKANSESEDTLFFTTARDIHAMTTADAVPVKSFVVHPEQRPSRAGILEREPENPAEVAMLDRLDAACGTRGGPRGWSALEWYAIALGYMKKSMLDDERDWFKCVRNIDDASVQSAIEGAGLDYPTYDIAVAFLKNPVLDARPATLPPSGAHVSLLAAHTLCGFGRHTQSDTHLVPTNNGKKGCIEQQFATISQTELSLGVSPGSICFGDSGGGAFGQMGENQELVGIISRAIVYPFSLRCFGGGIVTQVAPFVSWIESEIKQDARD